MFKLSAGGEEFVKKELTRYETKRSAIIPCLYKVQEENGGWVSPESVAYLSGLMGLPEAWVNEVLNFYTMFIQSLSVSYMFKFVVIFLVA